jgi:hypothetical protein
MNKRSSVAASMAPKIDLAQSYLQLQRLRQLVEQAESLQVRHGLDPKQGGCRINPQRQQSLRGEGRASRP